MKRYSVVAVALCLMMIALVGVGTVTARQDENPRQAGASSVYFYDVAATDAHGSGRLMINLDEHKFVFNGKDFGPSAMITLRASAADSTEIRVFATGKATPSGNLHVEGTWEADATPAEVVATPAGVATGSGYTRINTFVLRNFGGFVARIACYYSTDGGVTWHESAHGRGIQLLDWRSAELGDLGVPDGALVKMHAVVVGGKDRTGSEVFQYVYADWRYTGREAEYSIYGTTWNPELVYDGVWPS
jgi:hypothetical protein